MNAVLARPSKALCPLGDPPQINWPPWIGKILLVCEGMVDSKNLRSHLQSWMFRVKNGYLFAFLSVASLML